MNEFHKMNFVLSGMFGNLPPSCVRIPIYELNRSEGARQWEDKKEAPRFAPLGAMPPRAGLKPKESASTRRI